MDATASCCALESAACTRMTLKYSLVMFRMVIWPSAWRNHKLGLSSLYGGSWNDRGSEPVNTGVVFTAAAALALLGGITTTCTCCVFKN